MNYKILLKCIIILGILSFTSVIAQNSNLHYAVFDKKHLINDEINPDSLNIKSLSKADSTTIRENINVGRIIGFATIGFLSGSFFGASTDEVGFFQGVPVFHLRPALIGAGIGIVASFIIPDKPKKKRFEKRRRED